MRSLCNKTDGFGFKLNKTVGNYKENIAENICKELSYEDIRNNPVLEELLANNFTALGETVKPRDKEMGIGCTDMGNLTHLFPGLQSYVRVGPGRAHSPEFLASTGSPEGHRAIAVGACALAMTAVDISIPV